MLPKLKLYLTDPSKTLWVQPTLGAMVAICFSLFASVAGRILPQQWVLDIQADTLSSLIAVIASSMLAVTTFSLSIMVSALSATASSATPNARMLIMADGSTRIAISSFISAFIYSVIAKTALGLQYYDKEGRFVMFVGTVLVLIYLIVTLIRWVQTLSTLGSMGDTLIKVEKNASEGLARFRNSPNFGMMDKPPVGSADLCIVANQTGYLNYLLVADLQQWAEKHHCHIHIRHCMGSFISRDTPLFDIYVLPLPKQSDKQTDVCDVYQMDSNDIRQALNELIHINPSHSHHQDPRFGMLVLGEIGHRSLSQAVNDPSTAERTMTLITRLLIDTKASDDEITQYTHLSIKPFTANIFIESVFLPLARDGVGSFDFMMHMLACLAKIHHHAPEPEMRQAALTEGQKIYQLIHHYHDYTPDRQLLTALWVREFGTTPQSFDGQLQCR